MNDKKYIILITYLYSSQRINTKRENNSKRWSLALKGNFLVFTAHLMATDDYILKDAFCREIDADEIVMFQCPLLYKIQRMSEAFCIGNFSDLSHNRHVTVDVLSVTSSILPSARCHSSTTFDSSSAR